MANFYLSSDQASNTIIQTRIENNATITGSNMYILILSILVASIGLNMNSTAVVIGAMLISPLMNLVTSISYGIVVWDLHWLKSSAGKFLLQIIISILTSFVYFYLSPYHTFSSELLARTFPTLWDVLIALFAGFASIIAITRKNTVSNVIPGAAIATALMPPLCTIGFCLAHGRWIYAAGALYLFLINVIFICVSGVIGLKIMKISKEREAMGAKSRSVLIFIVLCAFVPSVFLAQEHVKNSSMQQFIKEEFQFENTHVVQSNIDHIRKKCDIVLVGSIVPNEKLQAIEEKKAKYKLEDYTIHIIQNQVEQNVVLENMDSYSVEDYQMEAKEQQVEIANDLLILYSEIASAGFLDAYDRQNEPSFTLLLQVHEELDEESIEKIKRWIHSKMDGELEVVQVKEGI